MADLRLTTDRGAQMTRIALRHVAQEYPNFPGHVLRGPDDLRAPRALHPLFYGSFDWHSCVHGYWLLSRLYRTCPALAERPLIRALIDRQVTPAAVAGELDYFRRAPAFERTYGWAWLLMLAAELERQPSDEGRRWRDILAPLARALADRFCAYLPGAPYPVRSGTHANSAFALTLALDYGETCGDAALAELIRATARRWFDGDADCQAWEPSGDDFLSPALIEAVAMQRCLSAAEFAAWFDRFLPRLATRNPATLFAPVTVADRSDGKIVHLDGLNLSRAWCWRSLAAALAHDDPRHAAALAAADAHLAASLPHIEGDYAGEHWLASFALLALEA